MGRRRPSRTRRHATRSGSPGATSTSRRATRLPGHPNAMSLEAWASADAGPVSRGDAGVRSTGSGYRAVERAAPGDGDAGLILRETYYSVGGGFIRRDGEPPRVQAHALPARLRERRRADRAVRRARHHDRRSRPHQRGGAAHRRGDRRGPRRDLGHDVGVRRRRPAHRRGAAGSAAGEAARIGDPRAARSGRGRRAPRAARRVARRVRARRQRGERGRPVAS